MLLVEGTRPVGVQGLILGGLEDVSSGGCSLSPASPRERIVSLEISQRNIASFLFAIPEWDSESKN
jgi:hypothetical protein